jgi:hypothetical protein
MLAEVRKARKDQALSDSLSSFLDDQAVELFQEASKPTQYDADYRAAAALVGDVIMDGGTMDANEVVEALLSKVPEGSFYHGLLSRLASYDLDGVGVRYGREGQFDFEQLGQYNYRPNGQSTVQLNYEALQLHNMKGDPILGARVMHTLTHELVHAVTHKQINSNPALRKYFNMLRSRAQQLWIQQGRGEMPYGLKNLTGAKADKAVHEFIAETFSDVEFQTFLKQAPVNIPGTGRTSLWDVIRNLVSRLLKLPQQAPGNIFDAIMLTEDILFDDAGLGGDNITLNYSGDAVMDGVMEKVHTNVQKAGNMWDRVKSAARNVVSFRQMRDMYEKFFETEDGNPFSDYMEAWGARNASVAKYMELPKKLSSRWTGLEQEDPASAQEVSRIGTEATMFTISPAEALDAKTLAEMDETKQNKYKELRQRYLALPEKAQKLYTDVASYYKKAADDEAKLLLSASLRGLLTKGKGAPLTRREFRKQFTPEVINGLKDEGAVRAALEPHFEAEQLDGFIAEVVRMASMRVQAVGDYFPLMRYGDYAVWVEKVTHEAKFKDQGEAMAERKRRAQQDPTLDVGVWPDPKEKDTYILRVTEREFVMAETKSEAAAARERLVQQYGEEPVSAVQLRLSKDMDDIAINSNAALGNILTTLQGNPAAQSAIKNYYLKSLSDQSFRKHEMKRKKRRGVNYDHQHRNLANYSKQSAYYRSQLAHGWQMGEALQEMESFTKSRKDTPEMTTLNLQQVVENIKYRDQLGNDVQELQNMVRKGVEVTQFMMLTSPSYWMINASQPWLVTAPIMGGRHGFGASYSALKHAFSMVQAPLTAEGIASWGGLKAFKDRVAAEKAFDVVDQLYDHLKKTGNERYISLIEELRGQNIIDVNVLNELRQVGEGVEAGAWARTLDASRILAHITEVNNRVVTAIAAYNLEMNRTGNDAAARKYAADMVGTTQFDYSSQNKPPLFQAGGPLKWAAPLMFQFMQWPQHMYALLIKNVHAAVQGESKEVRQEALKSLVGLLGTHAAVGGMVGMALQPIKWAFGLLMVAFGDDDEPYTLANAINGRTFDNLITEVMTDRFGSVLGGVFSRGLPTIFGGDASARMSMGTMYFIDLRGDTAESFLGSLVASFGGATLNQAVNWGNALGRVGEGDILRGVEKASPKIARDALRAIRYYNEGLVNRAGDTVIRAEDMSFMDVFIQAAGFQPDEVSRYYQGQAAIKGAQQYARSRREEILRDFADGDDRSQTRRDVAEFNRAFPSMKIRWSTLTRSVTGRAEREARYRRYGANIDEKLARDFAEYGEPFE